MCATRPRGFTLIELLVVISIIALLIAILLPALSSARSTARNMLCLSNQRQLSMAMHAYAVDHDDRFPLCEVTGEFLYSIHGTEIRWFQWDHALVRAGVISANEQTNSASNAFVCPEDPSPAEREITARTYGTNPLVSPQFTEEDPYNETGNAQNPRVDSHLGPEYTQNWPRLSEIRRASEVLLTGEQVGLIQSDHPFIDARRPNDFNHRNPFGPDWGWDLHSNPSFGIHGIGDGPGAGDGRANVSYVDGHAGTVQRGTEDVVGTTEADDWRTESTMFIYR